MTNAFTLRRAKRGAIWGRVLLFGQAGQGKTYTALSVAHHLCDLWGFDPREQLAVIDTELVDSPDRTDHDQGSAEKYEGRPCNCNACHREGLVFCQFKTLLLPEQQRDPESFMRAMKVCAGAGIKVIVLDGITDAWRALLNKVDRIKKGNRGADGWAEARPLHNAFVRALLTYPGHVIATCRAKKESRHKQAEDGVSDVIPDQDSNILHEFDIALFCRQSEAVVAKTRDDRLEGWGTRHPGLDLAAHVKRWCEDPRNPAGELAKLKAEALKLATGLPQPVLGAVEAEVAKATTAKRLQAITARVRQRVAEQNTKTPNRGGSLPGEADSSAPGPGAVGETAGGGAPLPPPAEGAPTVGAMSFPIEEPQAQQLPEPVRRGSQR